jgi:protein SCO1/2
MAWLLALVALIAAAGGLWLAHITQSRDDRSFDQATLRDGPLLRLPQAKALADFELYDDAGEAFSKAAVEGGWTLVFWGFSSCPHICPDTLFQLVEATDQLRGSLAPERVPNILFVGVDPERDTPEALKRYRDRFGNAILAVSGPDPQLRALAMQLGVHYVVPDHNPDGWYNVDHSMSVLLLNPRAQWVGLLSAPHESTAMAQALQRFLEDPPSALAGR